jgi:hypothetical protein
MDRCPTCNTDGKYDFKGQFVSRDWLRAVELQQENDRLRGAMLTVASLLEKDGDEHGVGGALRRALTGA